MNHGNYAPMPIIWGMGAVWDTGQVINPPIIAEIKVPPEQLHPEARNLYEHSAELSVLTEDGRPFLGSTCEVLEYTHSALAEKPSFQTNLSVNMGDRISFFFGPPAVGSWLRFTKEARCRKYQLRCDFKISVKDGGFWVPRTIIGSSISPVVEIQNHDKPWRIVHLPSDQVQAYHFRLLKLVYQQNPNLPERNLAMLNKADNDWIFWLERRGLIALHRHMRRAADSPSPMKRRRSNATYQTEAQSLGSPLSEPSAQPWPEPSLPTFAFADWDASQVATIMGTTTGAAMGTFGLTAANDPSRPLAECSSDASDVATDSAAG